LRNSAGVDWGSAGGSSPAEDRAVACTLSSRIA
jgi:hypothetical protein